MHHYLPKGKPQTRIKFFHLNPANLNIEDEHFYAAENLTEEDLGAFQAGLHQSKNGRPDKKLLAYDIHNLLINIDKKRAEELAAKEAFKKEQMDRALDEFDMTDDFEVKPVVAAKVPN